MSVDVKPGALLELRVVLVTPTPLPTLRAFPAGPGDRTPTRSSRMSTRVDEKSRYQPQQLDVVDDLRARVAAECIRPCRGASCGRVIVVLPTERGNTLPVDPVPAPGGRVILLPDGRARVLKKAEQEIAARRGLPLYNSHFATCPEGPAFRQRSRR